MEIYKGLLVEDEKVIQRVHGFYLKSLGYNFDLAENAESTLDYLKRQKYDFILLDNGLPDIQGVDLCKMIRQTEKKKNAKPVPIIFLTTHHIIRHECFEAGCNDFMIKPVSQESLKNLIEYWIRF